MIRFDKLSAADRAAVKAALGGRRGKYNAHPTDRVMPNGSVYTFDSKREAERYDVLCAMLRAGQIRRLRLQPQFTLTESYIDERGERVRALRYVADFSYIDGDGNLVVEDAKGMRTKEYRAKVKMLEDRLGVMVREV